MTKDKILNGNILIAKFMNDIDSINSKISFKKNCSIEDLKYHSSWNWLIPVIAKIVNQNEELKNLDNLKYSLFTNNITEAWEFVVNYLENN